LFRLFTLPQGIEIHNGSLKTRALTPLPQVVASCSQENKSHPPEIMKWQMHEFDQLDQLKFGQYKKSRVYSKQDHVLW